MTWRAIAITIVAVAASACGGNQSMFNPQGPAARSIAGLGWLLFGVSTLVYLLVLAASGWALARRRRPEDDEPDGDRALTKWVTVAAAVTVVTLLAMTVASVAAGRGLTSPSGPGAVTVDVIGHQWWWDFQYRDVTPSDIVASPNELHIPVGVPVVLNVMSRDVIHSFWVPNLHGKRDLIPGQVTRTWIQADAPGVYRGQCAEFCGHQHANMALIVVAEPMAQFREWLQQQRRPAPEPSSDLQRRGREVFLQSPCASCHTIRGTDAGSRFGPELTHVASRRTIAAGTLPNTRGHLAEWIADAQAIKPGSRMPSNVVAAADLQALLSYVRSLR
jgi:cytochrome c oxidase subunit 2